MKELADVIQGAVEAVQRPGPDTISDTFKPEGDGYFTPVAKDAAFERLHPRDPLNGRWVVIVGGTLNTSEALGHDLDHAAERVAHAHSTGQRAEARALVRRGRGQERALTPEETKILADAAARKLGAISSKLPGDVRIPAKDAKVYEGSDLIESKVDNKLLAGRKVAENDPDQALYHVSVHARAVRESGYLTVGKGGGLGAFGKEQSVSFTTDRKVAKMLEADLKRNIRFAAIEPQPAIPKVFQDDHDREYPSIQTVMPTKRWIAAHPDSHTYPQYMADIEKFKATRAAWSEKMYALLAAEAKREGFTLPDPPGTDEFKSMSQYGWGDWVNFYYGNRPEWLGGNPVFLGLSYENGHEAHRARDPRDIGVFTSTTKQAGRTGALMSRVPGLSEVRVYGDVGVAPH